MTRPTAMPKDSKPALTPKLRFPEFRKAPAWETMRLIDLADKNVKWSFAGGPFGSNLKASDYLPNGVRIIQLQNIGDAEFLDDYQIFTSEEKADELLASNIYPGDILLSKMGDPVARACIVPRSSPRFVMCSDGIRLVVDESRHDKYFVFLAINSDDFRRKADNVATGSTRKRIGLDVLRELSLFVPRLPEQQKIAECLSTLDELIGAESQKLDALKVHKKGLMQQLFPREGETLPRLRFPEFRNAPEWEETSLGEVARLRNGYAFRSAEYVESGEFQIITIANVQQGRLELSSTKRIEALPPDIQSHQILHPGDILISMTGNVGRVCVVDREGLLLNQRVGNLVPQGIDRCFFYQLLQRDDFRSTMQLKAAGGAQGNLSSGDISEYSFRQPCEPAEQHRIATCLSSLDDLIAAQSERISALQTHKQGLLQQLFPSPTSAEA